MRPSPVPEGISIGPAGAMFNENTVAAEWPPYRCHFSISCQHPETTIESSANGRMVPKPPTGILWEGSPGTLSAGEFAGIKLTIAGQPHFGWIRIAIANENHPPGTASAHNGSPYKVTAIDWAYETTPNTAILAGDIGSIVGPTGDYNVNGVVDAADYTVWRNTLGQDVAAGTGADGDQSGKIDAGDYTFWKTNFGNNVPGSGAGSGWRDRTRAERPPQHSAWACWHSVRRVFVRHRRASRKGFVSRSRRIGRFTTFDCRSVQLRHTNADVCQRATSMSKIGNG